MNDSYPWWLWPNLLALDAPLVAVVWQWFLADAAGFTLPLEATVVLALTVWGIYLADRWLDVRGNRRADTDRHRFAARHPLFMPGLASIVLSVAGSVAWVGLPAIYLVIGGVIIGVAAGYFAVIHLVRSRSGCAGLKELSVGVLFAAGVALPLLATLGQTGFEWLPGVVAFAGLCALNCLFISWWEDPPTTAAPRWVVVMVAVATTGTAVAAVPTVSLAVLASLSLLCGLNLIREQVTVRGLRVLADAVLLTPLVVAALA